MAGGENGNMTALEAEKKIQFPKRVVSAITFGFTFFGVLLILVGTKTIDSIDGLLYFLLPGNEALSSFLIFVGSLTCAIGFTGYYGSEKKNTAALVFFVAASSIGIMLELATVIAVSEQQDGFKDLIANNIYHRIASSSVDFESESAMDNLQKSLRCCGAVGPDDWISYKSVINNPYPKSCCYAYALSLDMNGNEYCPRPFSRGCAGVLSTFYLYFFLHIRTFVIVSLLCQITSILFACRLIGYLRFYKLNLQRKQSELRENLINIITTPDYPVKPPITATAAMA